MQCIITACKPTQQSDFLPSLLNLFLRAEQKMAFNLGPKVSSGINNMYSGLVSLSLEFTREINNREDRLDLERLRSQPLQRCGTTCVFYSSSPCYL